MTWFSDISNESESKEYSSYSSLNVNKNGECEASNSYRESNDCRSSTTDRDTKNMMNMESEVSNSCRESNDCRSSTTDRNTKNMMNKESEASSSCRESNDCRSSTTDRDTKSMMNMESEASNCRESGDNGNNKPGPNIRSCTAEDSDMDKHNDSNRDKEVPIIADDGLPQPLRDNDIVIQHIRSNLKRVHRKRLSCPVKGCGAKNLLKLSQHLLQTHDITNRAKRIRILQKAHKVDIHVQIIPVLLLYIYNHSIVGME